MNIPRKLVKIGGSFYVAIPPSWIEYNERRVGKPIKELLMELLEDDSIILRVEEITQFVKNSGNR